MSGMNHETIFNPFWLELGDNYVWLATNAVSLDRYSHIKHRIGLGGEVSNRNLIRYI